ncbi:MAG TPA: hypothetical protein EYG85_11950 [Crocinitomix sp.]|nr:hypothetical protein [Crocinitomix sp.]
MKSNYILLLLLTMAFSACVNTKTQPKPIYYNKYALEIEYEDDVVNQDEIDFEAHEDESRIQSKRVKEAIETVPTFIQAGQLPRKLGQTKVDFLKNPKKRVKISVENIPLSKFIHLVFGEVFKLNYTVSKEVEQRKDSVTLRMEDKVTQEKLYVLAESLLSNYKITVVNKNGILLISNGTGQNKQKMDYKISFGKSIQYQDIPENEMIYQILPIEYLTLTKARNFLTEFALSKNDARIYEMKNINALLIKDYVSNIRRGIELLNSMDKPYMKKKTFKLIHLSHVDVGTFHTRLEKILASLNINIAPTIEGEPITLLPIEEINALFVITSKVELLETIMYWKRKLDNLDKLKDKKQLFVYKTKNREAKEIESILTSLLEAKQEKTASRSSVEGRSSEPQTIQKETTRITVDEERNTLIFYMLPQEYKEIYELLKKVDTKAKQVLIEITIAEVTLVDKLQYGIEWFLKNSDSRETGFSLQTLGNLGIGSGGISGAISKASGGLSALLNAFAQDNVLKILSSPKLIVLNNKTATFNVGTQVPIITSQATAADLGSSANGTPTLLQSVVYQNTGISTSITPTITADNSIVLKINQTLSEAQINNTSAISSPLIINRDISTEVSLRNGEELIIAGIIRENGSNSTTKVPFLGDIPIIGKLFQTYSVTNDKTELIFIVKPHILNKMKNTDSIIESFKKISSFND